MGPMECGALQLLPALLHCSSPTYQGPDAAAGIGTSAEQVKQAKGKQDFGYPRKRKGISAVYFNLLWLFFKHKKLQTSQVTYLNSKTFQKPGHTTLLKEHC